MAEMEWESALLALAVEQTRDAIIATDAEARITFVNAAFERVSGYTRDEVLGRNPRLLQAPEQDPAVFADMWAALSAGNPWRGELLNRHKTGRVYTDVVRITPVRDDRGQLRGYLSVQLDVSHIREVEADLVLEARVRALLGEAVQAGFATTTLEEAAQAVCDGLVDLPRIDIAHVLAFLEHDVVVVASRSPDGFPMQVGHRIDPARAADVRRRTAAGPWGEVGSRAQPPAPTTHVVEAVAFGPIRHGDDVLGALVVGTLDAAAAGAVADKMPALVGFGASTNRFLVERMAARRRAERGRRRMDDIVAGGAFTPVFQPIVDLTSGYVVGHEALTRFADATPPDRCFAEAWAVGRGPAVELATAAAAVDAARALPTGGWLDLNVSPRLLTDPVRSGGAGEVGLGEVLARADRPVVLEVTEHEPIPDYRALHDAVAALGEVGVAVDDAGVGIANFGHIVELRADYVKLDMSLVQGVSTDPGRRALVTAMLRFAQTAGCTLVAEGVEVRADADALVDLGVRLGQGFLFGRPAPAGL
ncbi:EAL domain-containing protein [Euzebya sp.]|uniref:EAL domain-containing protein n=1 Tax=Euzebya sp. TaxID=1971409 RepID=UPI0035179EBF